MLALGGSGGMRIPTGVTQVLLASLAFGRAPADASPIRGIDTPPSGGLPARRRRASGPRRDLAKRGEVVDTTKPNFSAVQAIAVGARGIEAAGDPRKGGVGLVE